MPLVTGFGCVEGGGVAGVKFMETMFPYSANSATQAKVLSGRSSTVCNWLLLPSSHPGTSQLDMSNNACPF